MRRDKNGIVCLVYSIHIGYHGILLLGKLLKYMEGKWREVAVGDKLQLTKTEAQVFCELVSMSVMWRIVWFTKYVGICAV